LLSEEAPDRSGANVCVGPVRGFPHPGRAGGRLEDRAMRMMPLAEVLNLALWLPLAGAIVIALLPRGAERFARWIVSALSVVVLALSLQLFLLPSILPDTAGPTTLGLWAPQFMTSLPWIAQINARYTIGLDGLSGPMFLLNSLLVFLAVLISWNTKV